MAGIRIWNVESDYNAEALKSLTDSLTTNLKLDDLSVQTVDNKAFLFSSGSGESLNGKLKKAIRYYLKQDDYVIFLADSKSSVSARPCSQKVGALIEQIKQIVVDPDFAGKVFSHSVFRNLSLGYGEHIWELKIPKERHLWITPRHNFGSYPRLEV